MYDIIALVAMVAWAGVIAFCTVKAYGPSSYLED